MNMFALKIPVSHRLEDLVPTEVPAPSSPAQGQLLVRMEAFGLNYRDLLVATAYDRWAPPPERILGSDGVGSVIAVGPGVSRFATGDRVMTTFLPHWIDGPLTETKRKGALGGPSADGVFAQLVLMDENAVISAPGYLSAEEAATLPIAALTAWHALTRAGAIREGARVLVQGAGGVSIFALQIAAAVGAKAIAVSRSDEKLERMRLLGAEQTINTEREADWGKRVFHLADGRGVDVAIDIGGASSLHQSIQAVSIGGNVSVVGLVGGLKVELDLAELFQKNLRLDGIETGSRTMLEEMLRWFEKKKLRPIIDSTFSFEQSKDAFLHLRRAQHVGKVCIVLP